MTTETQTYRRYLLENGTGRENYSFARYLSGAVGGSNRAIAEHLAVVLERGFVVDNICAAECIPGADVAAHMAVVLERGTGHENYLAAQYIPGADKAAHLAVVLERGDGWENYLAARDVPEADTAAHLARARELGYNC